MFNVRLAGGHLYGKQLFTWLSLVVSFMASFVLSFFTLDVLGGIWDLIESVSEGFLTYFYSDNFYHFFRFAKNRFSATEDHLGMYLVCATPHTVFCESSGILKGFVFIV